MKTGTIIAFIIFIIIAFAVVLYGKPAPEEEAEEPSDQAEEPAAEEETTIDGLQVEVLEAGDGPVVESGDTVVVHYVGTLTDGTEFDSSRERGEPFVFELGAGRVIPGWEQGLEGQSVGSMLRLTIPSHLGYGSQGIPDTIPPNATLIFEVELLERR